MQIPEHIKEKLQRLYSDRFLGKEEIASLEIWLEQTTSNPTTEEWLSYNWDKAGDTDVEISFEDILRRIKYYNQQPKISRIKNLAGRLQRVAALLAIPLLILSVWLLIDADKASTMALVTAKGEHTHLFLPDGTEVWLNVDTRLEYASNFNSSNRELELNGEAFFKVTKGHKYPFIVKVNNYQVKAVGTEFNISAYKDDSESSTYLKEGIVELSYPSKKGKMQQFRLKPGEIATIDSTITEIVVSKVPSKNIATWMDGELIFDNEPMDQAFRKVERWYNIIIEYDSEDFLDESITLKLKKGEAVGRLFDIMNEAMGVNININGNTYVITRE